MITYKVSSGHHWHCTFALWIPLPIPSADRACFVSRKTPPLMGFDRYALEEDAEEAMVESDTDSLLLHDMHNGILAIGTFSHHHPRVSRSHSDPEEFLGEDRKEAQGVEGAKLFAVAREPSFIKIELPVEDEKTRTMELVQVHQVLQVSEKKILELPLLKEDRDKRERRRRTTLADLLAANALKERSQPGGQAAGNPWRQEHAAQEQ
ncbi:hypothetical protein GW17_00023145 [Ensete ventricosum]|nr:hypothetical protein GW17_00023145 [Ensete ventricosum]RZR91372.1 hypothetical protein BHM03_00019489 [Ensete ventricosum]